MDFHRRRILISGAAGFIGGNLARALVGYGAKVHAVIRPSTNRWRLQSFDRQITIHVADLCDRATLQKVVKDIQPEFIFHMARSLAASTPDERLEALHSNVIGLHNLLEVTDSYDYHHFVCAASSLEYGTQARPLRETDALDPLLFFGATKAAATILCRQYARSRQRPISILRIFSVYGPWETPKRLIPTAIVAALLDRELPLTPAGFRHDFVFVEDVVQACLNAAKRSTLIGEIINIGTGVQISNEDIVARIGNLCGRKIRVRAGAYIPHEADTSDWVAHNRKAKRLIDWTPQHTMEQGLTKTIDWLKDHLDLYQ